MAEPGPNMLLPVEAVRSPKGVKVIVEGGRRLIEQFHPFEAGQGRRLKRVAPLGGVERCRDGDQGGNPSSIQTLNMAICSALRGGNGRAVFC